MNRSLYAATIITSLLLLAYGATCIAPARFLEWMSFEFVFGTLFILLGFLLTIYTFAIPLLDATTAKLVAKDQISAEKKKAIAILLASGFRELRQSIMLVAYILLLLLVLQVVVSVEVPIPFRSMRLGDWMERLEPTCFLGALLVSLVAVFDILFAMFNVVDAYLDVGRH